MWLDMPSHTQVWQIWPEISSSHLRDAARLKILQKIKVSSISQAPIIIFFLFSLFYTQSLNLYHQTIMIPSEETIG